MGTRIVATVHLPLFPPSDGSFYCAFSYLFSFVHPVSSSCVYFSSDRAPLVTDASVCPLSIPWFDGTSVVKDPLPIDEVVDLPCTELLNENRTLISKYPETFLCLVGLSRSFVEMDVHPTLLRDDDEGSRWMSLDEVSWPIMCCHVAEMMRGKFMNKVGFYSRAGKGICEVGLWEDLAGNSVGRNAEIVDLNTWLEKSEAEVDEVIELRKRVSDLEATVAVKVGELANLRTKNVGLVEKDAAEPCFVERASELDARIADVRRDMDNDLYPNMLTAIAGRRWVIGHGLRLAGIQQGLEAGVVHGKASRSLAQLEAYDPEVEGKYVAAVSEFENISFPLLDELESLKDSPFASIMSALVLKDDQGNVDGTLEFACFQPSLDQVVVPVYSDSGSVDHEMLLSEAIPSVLSDDGGPVVQPPIVQAHDDLFNASVLDGASA
ncbi:hypothetical protein Tco_1113472 [Tanacetum coccineum]|uniref:Transposase (Putative), gypsy type n=1 Tax=Tanacetum coccineum TaxID=301880 RepID=A0ABQ5IW02_9ASTR